MTAMMMARIEINENILNDLKYDYLFSVEEVNRLVLEGMPFRDAYKKVGLEIEAGNFKPDKNIRHTHEGSIGNLCNEQIRAYKESIEKEFNFEKVARAIQKLVE